ncbi:hypothetical protein Tcan_12250 [Toxocara canis]|uniref:Zasp-like motif domain-containing protein n=1 Tax=Toxocara canis TaxID=6265 RepID=A0A0B2VQS8_TOXCA|nr:hypothetical protein Tcan_12250 [Toxocara canis]
MCCEYYLADKPIPLGPASAPVQQSETKAPVSGSIPAPPPPPPGTAFSAKVNPIKPPGASSNASARVASERSPVSPSVRRTPAENQAHAVAQQSPKVRRELSPQATIRHLQYNSPMNIYSMESAAEQYLRQTGGLSLISSLFPLIFGMQNIFPNRLKSQDPGYLHSQTLRLIEEEERGLDHRATSPAQSSSFKRISAACGTPVE